MDIVSGIKCDNVNCDYDNPAVTYAEYPEWINRPCPKCGENLLTQEDYDICLQMDNMTKMVEGIPGFKDLLQNAFDETMFKGIGEDGMVSFDTIRDLFKGVMPIKPVDVEIKDDTIEIKDIKEQPYFSGDCFPYTPPTEDVKEEPKKSTPEDKYYPKGEKVGKIIEKLELPKKKTRRSKNRGNNLLGYGC